MNVRVVYESTVYGVGKPVLNAELQLYQALVIEDSGNADLSGIFVLA